MKGKYYKLKHDFRERLKDRIIITKDDLKMATENEDKALERLLKQELATLKSISKEVVKQ